MATSYARLRPRSQTALRAESLLGRYPNLSEQQLAELINLLPRLGMLDQSLLAMDDRLSGKFTDFRREHRSKLKPQRTDLIMVAAFAAIVAAFTLWSAFA
jgi:hypothetical protein